MAASKTELLPWEARLAAALPGGKEDLAYLRMSFGPMKQAGWKDRESAKNPRSDCKSSVCAFQPPLGSDLSPHAATIYAPQMLTTRPKANASASWHCPSKKDVNTLRRARPF